MDRNLQSSHEFAYRRRLRRKAQEPNRLEILKASMKTVSKEYCEEASICGLKHLVDENTPFIERYVHMWSYVKVTLWNRQVNTYVGRYLDYCSLLSCR